MKKMFKRANGKLMRINVDQIMPNPNQPRKDFDENSLVELAMSIKEYGVLQPISVRRAKKGYELVAGERRVRACKIAGITEIPAMVMDLDNASSAALALIENLQRENLSYLDEAMAYSNLINDFGMTQEDVARKVGKSQATIANKLRVLRLDEQVKTALIRADLTERHARALLRLEDTELQMQAIAGVCGRGLNVKQTEDYINEIIHAEEASAAINMRIQEFTPELAGHDGLDSGVIGDVRIFAQTLKRTVEMMRRGGIEATSLQNEGEGFVEYVVKIAK